MPWKVFYSYAHEDQELCERLGVFLAPLKRQGKIIEWYDRKIEPAARDRQSSVQAKHVEAYQRLRLVTTTNT
jgi:hypothetical protein